jgi:hypothetical protein
VNEQSNRYARLRHTATGALAALAAVGAIAGAVALAARPHAHATATNGSTTKTPAPGNDSTKTPAPGKRHSPQPPEAYNPNNPFVVAIRRLVNDGPITATEGQAVDREILSGYIDPQKLASIGLTQTQVQAVEQALSNTKRALAPGAPVKNRTPQQHAKSPRS